MITSDVQSGQCSICQQGVMESVPVLTMTRSAGMRTWEVSVCKKCASEMRQHLHMFLNPREDRDE